MEMNTELVCVIASLGYNDGDEYFKSHDCLGDDFKFSHVFSKN